jgi:hypothetical protein
MVELHASRKAALGEQAELGDDELVELAELAWGDGKGATIALTSLGHSCIVSRAGHNQDEMVCFVPKLKHARLLHSTTSERSPFVRPHLFGDIAGFAAR